MEELICSCSSIILIINWQFRIGIVEHAYAVYSCTKSVFQSIGTIDCGICTAIDCFIVPGAAARYAVCKYNNYPFALCCTCRCGISKCSFGICEAIFYICPTIGFKPINSIGHISQIISDIICQANFYFRGIISAKSDNGNTVVNFICHCVIIYLICKFLCRRYERRIFTHGSS